MKRPPLQPLTEIKPSDETVDTEHALDVLCDWLLSIVERRLEAGDYDASASEAA